MFKAGIVRDVTLANLEMQERKKKEKEKEEEKPRVNFLITLTNWDWFCGKLTIVFPLQV